MFHFFSYETIRKWKSYKKVCVSTSEIKLIINHEQANNLILIFPLNYTGKMETQVFRLTFGIFLVVALILPPSHTLENKTRPVEINPKPPGTGTQVVTESELEKLGTSNFFFKYVSDFNQYTLKFYRYEEILLNSQF